VENLALRKQDRRRLQFKIQHLSEFGVFLYITTLTLVISQIFVKILDVGFDATKPMHQTSGLAFGQLFFWVSIGLTLFVTTVANRCRKYDLVNSLRYITITIVGLISGIMTGTALVALDGTPFYFGLYEGDLGAHMLHVERAIQFGWDQSGYPPLWSAIVGRLSVFLNLDPFLSYKFISIYFIGIWSALNLVILRKAFPPLLAELLAIYLTFSFSIDGWKSAGETWTQMFLLILIMRLYLFQKNQIEFRFLERLKTMLIGLLFGLSVTLYYGRFWWTILSLALAMGLTLLIKQNREKLQLSVIDFVLGAAIALLPVASLRQVSYGALTAGDHFILVWWILITFNALWITVRLPNSLQKAIGNIFFLMAPILIFFEVSKVTISDTYAPANLFGNMVPDFGFSSTIGLIVIVLFVTFGLFVFNRRESVLTLQVGFLASNMLSALLMKFYYAFEMYKTENIELYPRANSTIMFSWFLIISIFTYLMAKATMDLLESKFVRTNFSDSWQLRIAPIFIVTIIVALYASGQLSQVQWEMFPREGNYSWYAWTSRLTYQG
jgi:hypothetical protein